MAKRKGSTERNLWTDLFTTKEYHIAKRLSYNLELVIYDYYKYLQEKYTVFGVKSSVCGVKELKGNTISPIYNQYVKEAKSLSPETYGIQLEFLYEENNQGDEDDL